MVIEKLDMDQGDAKNDATSVVIDIKGESNLLLRRKNSDKHKGDDIKHLLSEEPFHIKDMAILEVLQPLYITMACCGLHWTGKNNWFRNVKFDRFTIHCISLLLISWTLAIGCFMTYEAHDRFGNGLFRKLFLHLYCIHVTLSLTVHIFSKHRHIPGLLKLWENYKLKYGGTSIKHMKSYVKKLVFLINACFIIAYIMLVYPLFTTDVLEQYLSSVLVLKLYLPVDNSLLIIFPAYMVMTYFTMANIQTILFTLSLNHLLTEEFNALTRDLSKAITNKSQNVRDDTKENSRELKYNESEQCRQRHFDLCNIVTCYDNATTNFHAVLYTMSIPIIILLIFSVFGLGHKSEYETAFSSYLAVQSMVLYLIVLMWITVSAANVATAVSMVEACATKMSFKISLSYHKSDHVIYHQIMSYHSFLV